MAEVDGYQIIIKMSLRDLSQKVMSFGAREISNDIPSTVNALHHSLNAKCKTKWCWVGNLDAFWGHNGGFPFHPPIFLSPEL